MLGLCTLLVLAAPAQGDDLNHDPIHYKTAKADNAVTALQSRIASGTAKLTFDDDHGYLSSVLAALDVPRSSQMLVFSKTSLQRTRITPKTPRALYFNDDVYVGFCLRGDVLEISAADPGLGTAFYTLDQTPEPKPAFARQTDSCLTCHASSTTDYYPGHLVRSVFPDRHGLPILSAGSSRTNHTSPFAERWGGWYVTGTHGPQTHRGNWLVSNEKDPAAEGNPAGQNVTDLKSRFTVANYLTPHSDLVALLVFEHQIEAHNRIARAMIETRQALHYETELNKSFGEPAGKTWDSARRRIESAADRLAKYLLFAGEAKLDGPVQGTSTFAEDFARRGPFDKQGRSLRQFDLKTRLFTYPCSYLIYSKAFAALPAEVKRPTLHRLHQVLTGHDPSPDYAHLSKDDRTAIREVLRDTMPDLPDEWTK
jgi:hypothetical protein